ncbi:GNAT family N-acetyltransferase [Nocardioides sp. R-C-SC26]|uniref:GNAT family N-acetyltransferase n=1 Tax=Nocardioides sp. R-C-SC26 TaxID=2870414 RepID=UPI001E3DDCC6|nr:GNAT family N-acetyltransferase [Nocardioides sp. R-C-SC26]
MSTSPDLGALPPLPDGYDARPLRFEDAEATFAVIAAEQAADLDHVAVELADIVGEWQRPSFDVETSTIGVFRDGTLIAFGERTSPRRCDAAVQPAHRGLGIGTWIAHWLRELARAHGDIDLGMPNPEGSPGDLLLADLGYLRRWTSWVLQLPRDVEIAERALPPGYAVRTAEAAEYRALHDVLEDAFLEWSAREREPLADFLATSVERPGFEPWMLRVVTDAEGAVVGAVHVTLWENGDEVEAYINRLAVRADQRNRGLAQALMVDCFAAGRARGATTTGLDTDSRTGALGLYEKVGMQVTSTWINRAAVLAPSGYDVRPLTLDDAAAVHAIIVAEEIADVGRADTDLDDIIAEWDRPGTRLSETAIGIEHDGTLVAYGELSDEHAFAAVHPDHQGRGLGQRVALWLELRARALGWRSLGGQVVADGPADRLLARRGYEVRWTAWDLELPPGATVPPRDVPAGYAVREATAADHEACWTLFEDAFLEWSDRDRKSLADFGALMWDRPSFAPWNLQVVTDPDGALAGAVFVTLTDGGDAYIHKLAVRADQRGRGLAQVLLRVAFGTAREHGAQISRLSTDTRAGARSLYEQMGMVVESTWVNRAKPLGS